MGRKVLLFYTRPTMHRAHLGFVFRPRYHKLWKYLVAGSSRDVSATGSGVLMDLDINPAGILSEPTNTLRKTGSVFLVDTVLSAIHHLSFQPRQGPYVCDMKIYLKRGRSHPQSSVPNKLCFIMNRWSWTDDKRETINKMNGCNVGLYGDS